ncbi:GLPGLI family protein [Chryseobacterium echinoideorum]|uniref:GLPGLI family protein n=1 Tax=Chryseobacterium echinoideorum TaxID=1549648 RepID=UPI0011856141|nr:GLPGLI family protein [Chryseobacterium echinoideorum]
MKISIIFLFFCCSSLFSQNLVVQYKYSKQKNVEDTTIISQTAFLRIDEKESLFFSEGEYLSDSIMIADTKNNKITNFRALPEDYLGGIIGKDLEKREVVFYSNDFMDKQFKYSEKPDFKWIITNTKKEILGYNAVLAKTSYAGRSYEAYFTEQIPIQEGPYKFFGLPGLILEIYDTENKHCFSIMGISTDRNDITLDLSTTKFIETSRKKYYDLRKNYEDNPTQRMQELMNATQIYERADKNGNVVDMRKLVNDTQKSLIEMFKKQNKIELKP